MTDKLPWWAQLEKRRIVTKQEWERRYGGKVKKHRKRPKRKTPTQVLVSLCETYGISPRGNTEQIKTRLIYFIGCAIIDYQNSGAPHCFGQHYEEVACEACILQGECIGVVDDVLKVGRAWKKYLINKKWKRRRR